MPRNVRCALIQAEQRDQHGSVRSRRSESDDRQAHEADRAGCAEENADPLPAGTFLRTIFLCGTKFALVRIDRARARWTDDAIMQKVAANI